MGRSKPITSRNKAKGDNDPLDVCEIGEKLLLLVKLNKSSFGCHGPLDEGETDWKVIVIDVNDPLAPKLNDIEDVETHLPGLLSYQRMVQNLQNPDGKPENQFAFSGECKTRNTPKKLSVNVLKLGKN